MHLALDPAMLIDVTVPELFVAAAAAGYGALELPNRPDFIPAFGPTVATPADAATVRRAAASADVTIASVAIIQAWSSPDDELREQAITQWLAGIDLAVELGARRLNSELSGDPHRPEASRGAFLRSIDALLPRLEREDLVLSIEPHPGDFLETTEGALDLLAEVADVRVRYLHCLPHTFYLGGSAADQISLAAGSFDHLHLGDTFRPGRTIVNPAGVDCRIHQHFDIGAGEIDWGEVSTALRRVDFDGLATVQVFGWAERATESFVVNRDRAAALFRAPDGTVQT